MSTNPKSQLEKRVDALEAMILLTGGVGLNVGNHNEIFNLYEDLNNWTKRNVITGGDYNTATGYGNTLTSCYNCFAGGQGNSLGSGSYHAFIYGLRNSATLLYSALFGQDNGSLRLESSIAAGTNIKGQASYSALFGDDFTVGNIYKSLLAGRSLNGGNVDTSAIIGDRITFNQVDNSIISGVGHNLSNIREAIIGGEYASANSSTRLAIGKGTSSAPENIFDVDSSGNVRASGSYGTMGADYAEYFEWEDGNPEAQERVGMLVSLSGDKIGLAHGDDFIGAISARASVIGNAFEQYWHGKYKTDVFGTALLDKNGKPIISEEFDPTLTYVPRSQRPEWSPVGLVGRLVIVDDGSCKPGGYVSARHGVGTSCYARTAAKVLRRIDENHVEVLIK